MPWPRIWRLLLRLLFRVFSLHALFVSPSQERLLDGAEPLLWSAALGGTVLVGKVRRMNSSQPERGRALGFVGVGLQFSATVVLLTLFGAQVDRWLHTKPAFLLVGLLLGLATATWDILRQVQRFDRKRPPR